MARMERWGRRIAVGTGAASLLVLGTAAWADRGRLIEEWHIRRLGSSDEKVRLSAAARLSEMRSVRAVQALIRAIAGDAREKAERAPGFLGESTAAEVETHELTPLAHAIYEIGPEALPLLEERVKAAGESDRTSRILTVIMKAWTDPEAGVYDVPYGDG